MPETNTILEFKDVSKHFGGITAASKITFSVAENEIHGIIGPNGAGKTTLFNMVTGVYAPSEGQILFGGRAVNGRKTHEIAQLGIARTFQNIRLFGDLTVYDNLLTACQKNITYGFVSGLLRTPNCRRQEKAMKLLCEEYLEEAGLTEVREQRANNLPYGMQRRLEIARALVTKPRLLLLDEPAAGMNEEESRRLSAYIRAIREKYGISIIIIDHHMDVIMSICDRMAVLNFGTLLAEGTPGEIQGNEQVIEAYLGVDE